MTSLMVPVVVLPTMLMPWNLNIAVEGPHPGIGNRQFAVMIYNKQLHNVNGMRLYRFTHSSEMSTSQLADDLPVFDFSIDNTSVASTIYDSSLQQQSASLLHPTRRLRGVQLIRNHSATFLRPLIVR